MASSDQSVCRRHKGKNIGALNQDEAAPTQLVLGVASPPLSCAYPFALPESPGVPCSTHTTASCGSAQEEIAPMAESHDGSGMTSHSLDHQRNNARPSVGLCREAGAKPSKPTGVMPSSNGLPIPFDAEHFVSMAGSDAAGRPVRGLDIEALRTRYREAGYVLLRRFLEPAQVIATRAAYLNAAAAVPSELPHGVPGHPAYAFVRSAEFDRFTKQPRLQELATAILQKPARLLPRRPLRHFRPGSRRASRAHTDFTYLDRGTREVVTIWIPLGACSLTSGGIVYLEGSHTLAETLLRQMVGGPSDRPHDRRPLTHDLRLLVKKSGRRLAWTTYEPGDVVLHSPFIVHATLDAHTGADRLSTDLRFIPCDAPPDERWLRDWAGNDGA